MKAIATLIGMLMIASTGVKAGPAEASSGSGSNLNAGQRTTARARGERAGKPNEVIGKRFTVSGIAVQCIKGGNLLQLINPAAPPEYGSGTDNLVPGQGQRAGEDNGWKVISIQF